MVDEKKQNQSQGGQCSWIGGGLETFLTLKLPTFHWECFGHKFAPVYPQPLIRKEHEFFFFFLVEKIKKYLLQWKKSLQ